jgi:hypothetical protein
VTKAGKAQLFAAAELIEARPIARGCVLVRYRV